MPSLRSLFLTFLLYGSFVVSLPNPQLSSALQAKNGTTNTLTGQSLDQLAQIERQRTGSRKEGVIVFNPQTGRVTDSEGREITNLGESKGHNQTSKKFGSKKFKFKGGSHSSNGTRSSKMYKQQYKVDGLPISSSLAASTSYPTSSPAVRLDSAGGASINETNALET